MKKILRACALCGLLITTAAWPALADSAAQGRMIEELRLQMQQMRQEMLRQRQAYEGKLEAMQRRLDALAAPAAPAARAKPGGEGQLAAALAQQRSAATDLGQEAGPLARAVQSMNPEVSVIIDTIFYRYSHEEGFAHISAIMGGFGHSHSHDDDSGHQHGLRQGFNLRHLELSFSAEVDPYFKGYANVAVTEDSAEIHEAYIVTSSLPWGFQLKAGKFFSEFSRTNSQHSHEWDFVDAPLIYTLTLGDHRLLDKGVQASWLAPLATHLLFGIEALQGDNENMFHYLGGDQLPEENAPRLWVGWAKWSPNLPGPHGLQFGAYFARGVHQEAHDGDSDGAEDHWLSGYSQFYGADMVYKYDSGRAYGQGDFTLQAEYFRRHKDLTVEGHDLNPAFIGQDRTATQDGYYVQGVYGFAPRWRAGLRWEQVGLTNRDTFPDGSSDDYDSSWRATGMVDFSPSHFSRIRLQTAYGEYAMSDGSKENDWQIWLQLQISLGSHGAHKF